MRKRQEHADRVQWQGSGAINCHDEYGWNELILTTLRNMGVMGGEDAIRELLSANATGAAVKALKEVCDELVA